MVYTGSSTSLNTSPKDKKKAGQYNGAFLYQDLIDSLRNGNQKTPRGRFELPRREAPAAFEATAFPG